MATALSRRGLLGAFIAAPAIVRVSSLMPIKAGLLREELETTILPIQGATSLLTINEITRETVRLFVKNNSFMQQFRFPLELNGTSTNDQTH